MTDPRPAGDRYPTRPAADGRKQRRSDPAHARTTLHGADRFEWERILRRCLFDQSDLSALMPPGDRARPVKGRTIKGIGLVLATFANADGTNAFPSVARLARTSESDERTVRTALGVLRAVGLIERVRRGSNKGTGISDKYRLTVPEDLLEILAFLGPEED